MGSYESGKLDGQLRVSVCVYFGVSLHVLSGWWYGGGALLSFLHTKPGDLAGLKTLFFAPLFVRREKNNKMKASVVVFPCCLYHSATRPLMQITDEELNHVCDWPCFLL